MNYNKLKELQIDTKVSVEDMAVIAEMSKVGYEKMLKRKTCTVEKLELIAKHFNVPVSYFFDETGAKPGQRVDEMRVVEELQGKYEILQVKLDGATALVESQKETIAALKGEPKKENLPENSKEAV